MPNKFIVGKTYKPTDTFPNSYDVELPLGKFTVSHIDKNGHVWTEDATFDGLTCLDGEGWTVCYGTEIAKGQVVEVVDVKSVRGR